MCFLWQVVPNVSPQTLDLSDAKMNRLLSISNYIAQHICSQMQSIQFNATQRLHNSVSSRVNMEIKLEQKSLIIIITQRQNSTL